MYIEFIAERSKEHLGDTEFKFRRRVVLHPRAEENMKVIGQNRLSTKISLFGSMTKAKLNRRVSPSIHQPWYTSCSLCPCLGYRIFNRNFEIERHVTKWMV